MFLLCCTALVVMFTTVRGAPARDDSDAFLSPQGLAKYLDLPLSTIYRWNYAGGGPKRLKIGRHVRYRLTDVAQWLDEQAEPRRSA